MQHLWCISALKGVSGSKGTPRILMVCQSWESISEKNSPKHTNILHMDASSFLIGPMPVHCSGEPFNGLKAAYQQLLQTQLCTLYSPLCHTTDQLRTPKLFPKIHSFESQIESSWPHHVSLASPKARSRLYWRLYCQSVNKILYPKWESQKILTLQQNIPQFSSFPTMYDTMGPKLAKVT